MRRLNTALFVVVVVVAWGKKPKRFREILMFAMRAPYTPKYTQHTNFELDDIHQFSK